MNYLHPSEIERLSHLSNHPFDEIRADSLTPSDYILLKDCQWVQQPKSPGLRVLRRRPGVDALIRAVATAVLVNEKAGNIRLQLTKSRYTRFNRFQHVEATFVHWMHRWPADSLEGRLGATGKVIELVSTLAGEDSSHPRTALTTRCLQLMVARGLLRHQVERYRTLALRWRTRERYLLGPMVWQALGESSAIAAERFIPSSAETRPELTDELLRDIRAIVTA